MLKIIGIILGIVALSAGTTVGTLYVAQDHLPQGKQGLMGPRGPQGKIGATGKAGESVEPGTGLGSSDLGLCHGQASCGGRDDAVPPITSPTAEEIAKKTDEKLDLVLKCQSASPGYGGGNFDSKCQALGIDR